MSPSEMPTERDPTFQYLASDAGGATETVTEQLPWPFAPPSEEPEEGEERARTDAVDERDDPTGYDATLDASFPASDPPPSPISHYGCVEK